MGRPCRSPPGTFLRNRLTAVEWRARACKPLVNLPAEEAVTKGGLPPGVMCCVCAPPPIMSVGERWRERDVEPGLTVAELPLTGALILYVEPAMAACSSMLSAAATRLAITPAPRVVKRTSLSLRANLAAEAEPACPCPTVRGVMVGATTERIAVTPVLSTALRGDGAAAANRPCCTRKEAVGTNDLVGTPRPLV